MNLACDALAVLLERRDADELARLDGAHLGLRHQEKASVVGEFERYSFALGGLNADRSVLRGGQGYPRDASCKSEPRGCRRFRPDSNPSLEEAKAAVTIERPRLCSAVLPSVIRRRHLVRIECRRCRSLLGI